MCYSKEVSLATSGIIFASSGYNWYRYYLNGLTAKTKALDPRVRQFIKYSIISFAVIGGHQLFEFLSIWTSNQVVYKTGLLLSISCTFFLILALEKLTGKRFGSTVFAAVIAGLGIYMFGREMRFENAHFYVRGFSHQVWSMTWMMLFLYWNCCVIWVFSQMPKGDGRRLLALFPWVFTNATYFLMLVYAFFGIAARQPGGITAVFASCTSLLSMFQDYRGIYDVASIWCALAALSALAIPFYLRAIHKDFAPTDLRRVKEISVRQGLGFTIISAAVLVFLSIYLPLLVKIGLKMVTK